MKKKQNNERIKNDSENEIETKEPIIDDLIGKILRIKEISEDKNSGISFKMNFDLKV